MSVSLKRDRTQPQETPLLWLGVLVGSLALHLAILLIGRWYLSRPASSPARGNPQAIEFVEIDPNAPTPSRSVAPSTTATNAALPKSQAEAGNAPERSTPAQSQTAQPQPETLASNTPNLEAQPKPQTSTPKPQPQRSTPPQQRESEKPITPPSDDRQSTTSPSEAPKTSGSTLPTPPKPSNPDGSPSEGSTTLPNPDNPGGSTTSPNPDNPGGSTTSPNPDGSNPGGATTPPNPEQLPKTPVDQNPGSPAVTGFSIALGQGELGRDVVDRPQRLAQPLETSQALEITSLPNNCSLSSEVIDKSGQTIVLRLRISEAGTVEGNPTDPDDPNNPGPIVLTSSGSRDYDSLARCLIRDWRFSPAYNVLDNKQVPVTSNLDLPVTVRISK